MNCPHCTKPIDDKLISKHLASKGGGTSKRTDMGAGSEGQKKAQEGRRKAKEKRDLETPT